METMQCDVRLKRNGRVAYRLITADAVARSLIV